MPAPASSALALASSSHDPGVRPARPRRPRRCPQALGVAGGAAQRRGADERGAQAGDGGDVGAGELPGGLVVEQLGQGRGDQRRHRARRGARADPLAHGVPALAHRAVEPVRLVVEHEHVVDRRVGADRGDHVAQGLDLAPDERRVVERVGDGRRRREQLRARARPCRPVQGRQVERRAAAPRRRPPESPPEQVRMASPPSPRGRAPRTASALASSSSSCTSCAQAAPASCTSARKAAWSPATAPVCAAAARRPRRRGADLEHRDADAGVRAQRERLAQPRAVAVALQEEGDRAHAVALGEACSQSPASTTAWLPHETTVCRRRPRRAASALTATLPLWEMTATWPGSRRHERVAPQRRAIVQRDDPVAVGPADRQVVAARPRRSASCSRAPPGVSPKPAP